MMQNEWDMDTALEVRGEERYADGRAEGVLNSLRNLIEYTKTSVDEAMNMLGIPMAERPRYTALLNA